MTTGHQPDAGERVPAGERVAAGERVPGGQRVTAGEQVPGSQPMAVREARIPVRDGTELAVTLYLPAQPAGPVPALLEYLPYRKDDAMLARDHELYAYLVAHGYAGARVDIRGTGSSDGDLPEGEYTEQEQLDAEDVIAWLAARPWCTGVVGMWGISWGGFNAIQVALRRPPALRAIIAVDASDDLFHDDVHYIDGLLHIDEYVLMMDHLNALPPTPDFRVNSLAFARRFDSEPWLMTWLARQQDGPYWRRASLRPDYGRLTVPAFLIGGWYDGYRDSVPRMLAAVPAPVKIMIGPWNHTFPHNAVPGPAIEWRADAVRWWDHWLKGAENGIMSEPPVTVYVRHWHPPDPDLAEIPGRWRAETAFPPERTAYRAWYCGPERNLSADPPKAGAAELRYVASAGVEAGHWWGELTVDQRGADAFSLVFDSRPLAEDMEILGFPLVELHGGADAEPLHWFGRLCDVAPDGTVTLVTGGGRAGQAGSAARRRLAPGRRLPGRPGRHRRAVRRCAAGRRCVCRERVVCRGRIVRGGCAAHLRRAGRAAAGAARHLVGVPARPPDPARAVQRDVADDLADAAPGHGHGAARAGRDSAGAARGARGPGGRSAGAGVRRARPGGAAPGDPALGRHGPGAVDPAAGRHRGRHDLVAGQHRHRVPLGPGGGRGVPALLGARRAARQRLCARRGPYRVPPGRTAADRHLGPRSRQR